MCSLLVNRSLTSAVSGAGTHTNHNPSGSYINRPNQLPPRSLAFVFLPHPPSLFFCSPILSHRFLGGFVAARAQRRILHSTSPHRIQISVRRPRIINHAHSFIHSFILSINLLNRISLVMCSLLMNHTSENVEVFVMKS